MAGIVDFKKYKLDASIYNSLKTKPSGKAKVYFEGDSIDTPIYSRKCLSQTVEGHAIILEESTTIIVPNNWNISPIQGEHLKMDFKAE